MNVSTFDSLYESEITAELQEAGTCSYGTSLTLSKSMPKSQRDTGFRSCHLTLSAGKGQFAFYSQMSMSYSDLCKPNLGKGYNYGQMRNLQIREKMGVGRGGLEN